MSTTFEELPFADEAPLQLRVPPHSIEAESSVIGGLLIDNRAWDHVADILTDRDFYRHDHQLIFAAIAEMISANRAADVVTVFERLQRQGRAEEVGGLMALNALAQFLPSAANMRRYAEIVRERSVLRQIVAAADEMATAAFNPGGKSVAEILDAAQQKVFTIGEQASHADNDWALVGDMVVHEIDRIQEHHDGNAEQDFTPTGLKDLDERLDGGLRPGDLVILGARPRMGKSAMAMAIADHIGFDLQLPVAVFTMEMPGKQLAKRLISMHAHIHLSRIKRPERLKDYDWPGLTRAVDELRRTHLYINDESGLTIGQMRAKARKLRRNIGRLGLIVVDYLGLTTGTDPKQPRTYQLEEVTKGFKALGKELGCPVLVLAQINRGVEQRTDQMPMLSDLRDSGAIEQDADIVMFLHREIVVKPELSEEWKYHAKVHVAKLRDGEPGFVDLMYVGENTLFKDWPEDQQIPTSRVRVASNRGT